MPFQTRFNPNAETFGIPADAFNDQAVTYQEAVANKTGFPKSMTARLANNYITPIPALFSQLRNLFGSLSVPNFVGPSAVRISESPVPVSALVEPEINAYINASILFLPDDGLTPGSPTDNEVFMYLRTSVEVVDAQTPTTFTYVDVMIPVSQAINGDILT